MTDRPVISANEALIAVEYRLGRRRWLGRGQHVPGRGFNVDVFRDGMRVAMRDGVWPTNGDGNRDVALVSQTMDMAIKEEPVDGLRFTAAEFERGVRANPPRRIA